MNHRCLGLNLAVVMTFLGCRKDLGSPSPLEPQKRSEAVEESTPIESRYYGGIVNAGKTSLEYYFALRPAGEAESGWTAELSIPSLGIAAKSVRVYAVDGDKVELGWTTIGAR